MKKVQKKMINNSGVCEEKNILIKKKTVTTDSLHQSVSRELIGRLQLFCDTCFLLSNFIGINYVLFYVNTP